MKRKVALKELEYLGDRVTRMEAECPLCGEVYLEDVIHYPGSFWEPPDWDSREVAWCNHFMYVDEDNNAVFAPRWYVWAEDWWAHYRYKGPFARLRRLFARFRAWRKTWGGTSKVW